MDPNADGNTGKPRRFKALRLTAIVLLGYVAIVASFETILGLAQPAGGGTLVISTFEADGSRHDRVLSRLESDGQLFVAANHWPRAWYRRALQNPSVEVTVDGATGRYLAGEATPDEHRRVAAENPHGFVFRLLTGFPRRRILRLDPVTEGRAGTGAASPVTIELVQLRGAAAPPDRHLGLFKAGFHVTDIAAAHRRLRSQGVDTDPDIFVDRALGARSFVFRDLDGNRLQLFERCAEPC